MQQTDQPSQVFKQAVAAVLAQWTLLTLAVEQGWGGRDSHRKRHELYEDLIAEFDQNKKVDAEELADSLSERLMRDFSVEVEDDSDLEVAKLLVDLYEQTSRGCFALATTVQQQQQQRATCVAQSHCVNGPADEGIAEMSEGSDEEAALESLMESSGIVSHTPEGIAGRTRSRLAAAAGATGGDRQPEREPEEEEGWTTVGPSGRNRRGH